MSKFQIGGKKASNVAPQAAVDEEPQAGGFKKPSPSWMKTGADAEKEFKKQNEANADKDSAFGKRKGMCWDFWMSPGEPHLITFLDGDLSTDPAEEGRLLYTAIRMHTVRNPKYANQWDNFVCLGEEETGCPFCEGGDDPTFCAVFPVIHHTVIQTKKGPVKDEIKLYIAKAITLKLLQKKAGQQGGLKYRCFTVERTDKKMARVGDQIDFKANAPLAAMQKKFPDKELVIGPAWYETNLPYFTRAEIAVLGFGESAPGNDQHSSGGGFTGGSDGAEAVGSGIPVDDDLPF